MTKEEEVQSSKGKWRYNSESTIRRAGRIQPARVQYIPVVRPANSRMQPPTQAKK